MSIERRGDRLVVDDPRADPGAILADLARVKALFQARTIALVIGAPMPDPAAFASKEGPDGRPTLEP